MLLITHDLGVVSELADRIVVMYAGQVVESGTRHQIVDDPRHPYTEALIGAVIPSTRMHRFVTVSGSVPHGGEIPTGCRFAPRCRYTQEKCVATSPPLVDIGGGQWSRCRLVGEIYAGPRAKSAPVQS